MNGNALITFLVLIMVLITFSATVGAVIYLVVRMFKQRAARIQELTEYAAAHNYGFAADSTTPIPNSGSYDAGLYQNYMWGMLQPANEEFYVVEQTETRGNGKSSTTYLRTIACLYIPDTRIQMIVNSKLNNDDRSGGNLSSYRSGQRYEAEGEFSKFFDIYMPQGAQIETLAILAPNTLEFIMQNLADYDIEIVNNQIYLYTYRFIELAELDRLISYMSQLASLMRLQAKDAVATPLSATPVARVAQDVAQPQRLVKRWHVVVSVGAGIGFLFFQILPHLANRLPALSSDVTMFAVPALVFLSLVIGLVYSLVHYLRKSALKQDYERLKQSEHDDTSSAR